MVQSKRKTEDEQPDRVGKKGIATTLLITLATYEAFFQLDPFDIYDRIDLPGCEKLFAYDKSTVVMHDTDPFNTGECHNPYVSLERKYTGNLEGRLEKVERVEGEFPLRSDKPEPITDEMRKHYEGTITKYESLIYDELKQDKPKTFWFHALPQMLSYYWNKNE